MSIAASRWGRCEACGKKTKWIAEVSDSEDGEWNVFLISCEGSCGTVHGYKTLKD